MKPSRKPNYIERDLIAGLNEFVSDLKADKPLTWDRESSSEDLGLDAKMNVRIGGSCMTTIRTMVQNRRIEVAAPDEIPDGAEVTLTIAESPDNGPLAPEEISRLLLAMNKLEPWDIPPAE